MRIVDDSASTNHGLARNLPTSHASAHLNALDQLGDLLQAGRGKARRNGALFGARAGWERGQVRRIAAGAEQCSTPDAGEAL